jgi:hypothetical protein
LIYGARLFGAQDYPSGRKIFPAPLRFSGIKGLFSPGGPGDDFCGQKSKGNFSRRDAGPQGTTEKETARCARGLEERFSQRLRGRKRSGAAGTAVQLFENRIGGAL